MPQRFQPTQGPLQTEIKELGKLFGNVFEQAARILNHFADTSQPFSELAATSPQLNDRLLEKCENFETVCDQIYYILEQSKRVLQLEWQEKMIQVRADEDMQKQKLLEKSQQQQEGQDQLNIDGDIGFENSEMDMDTTTATTVAIDGDKSQASSNKEANKQNNDGTAINSETIDEEDMEELLQIQRERLDRLKNVIVLGMDADVVKANGGNGDKEDLLF